jgi:MerR family transcriptional regulator, light-induced transcriptional regulator
MPSASGFLVALTFPSMTERNEPAVERTPAARLSRLYLDSLRAADAAGALRVASRALDEGMTTTDLYQAVIAPAMHEIGALWEKGAITVADEHLATSLTHQVLTTLRPPIQLRPDGPGAGRALLAAVEGERHALGLRMAADVLDERGYETIYLGADVPTEALLQAVEALSPELVALSATMPEAIPALEQAAVALREGQPQVRVLAGGSAAAAGTGPWTAVHDLAALLEPGASAT